MVFSWVKMPIDTERWRAGIVNNKFNYIFHAKRSTSGSLLNFYLSMLGPIVSMICYLNFLIIISVINVPFSVLLTFLSMNIPVDRLWFVCPPDEDVSHAFTTKLAIIKNYTQTALSCFKSRVTSTIFSMKDCSLKANKFLKMNKVTKTTQNHPVLSASFIFDL